MASPHTLASGLAALAAHCLPRAEQLAALARHHPALAARQVAHALTAIAAPPRRRTYRSGPAPYDPEDHPGTDPNRWYGFI